MCDRRESRTHLQLSPRQNKPGNPPKCVVLLQTPPIGEMGVPRTAPHNRSPIDPRDNAVQLGRFGGGKWQAITSLLHAQSHLRSSPSPNQLQTSATEGFWLSFTRPTVVEAFHDQPTNGSGFVVREIHDANEDIWTVYDRYYES